MNRAIDKYYKKLEILKHQSVNESSIRGAFEDLLQSYATQKDLILVTELGYDEKNRPDGTIKDLFRFDYGFWEAKDEKDNLDDEISFKLNKGYPTDNIIFENSIRAILIQNKKTVFDIDLKNATALHNLLEVFFNYDKPEVLQFHKALELFREDIPKIIKPIREKIVKADKSNEKFQKIYNSFLKMCQEAIDKNISKNDIFEMLLQHILTEDIFRVIFSDSEFHIYNNIAKKLNKLEKSFINREEKVNLFSSIRYYYEAIKSHSMALRDFKEKQNFLNVLYENFYRAYNPQKADTLGIIYTPLEIVDFMIDAVDFLSYEHFNKTLSSKNVKILDPATGTGTFLTQLMDYIPSHLLKQKYENEIFANEISILPYYIANLNLEYIYQQKVGNYKEFKNISFVDTLELNQKQKNLFDFTVENMERIKRQEDSVIDIIIGNPPYNANQQNENDNNRNKKYLSIDTRIKNTYIKNSTAQKAKSYDMYSRFYRWASDRIDDKGIVTFVTNSSFIDSKTFDGFRKTIFKEFNEIYILDLGGNIRKKEKDGNVFNIMVGVAIMFLVKKTILGKCKLYYYKPKIVGKKEKLKFLKQNKFNEIKDRFELTIPDKRNNWLNQTDNDWEKLIPMGTKECKLNKKENAIFKIYSNGILTARDDWVYDFDKKNLENKANFFINEYNFELNRWNKFLKEKNLQNRKFRETDRELNNFLHSKNHIKWSKMIKRDKFLRNKKAIFFKNRVRKSLYRPFIIKEFNSNYIFIDVWGQQYEIFPNNKSKNINICVSGISHSKPFQSLAIGIIPNLDFLEKTVSFSLYIYNQNNQKHLNITNYGLEKFRSHYNNPQITKEDIFYYCYGVLHNPTYRQKYEINLKQDLPRIPFYKDFSIFSKIGKELVDLHTNFEDIAEYPLEVQKNSTDKLNKPKLKLSIDKTEILIDEITTLTNFPIKALDYKLGNRSAIEWVLDGYKEKKIKDQTIAKMFDNYRFVNYKKEVISLLKKITTLSLKTLDLIDKISACDNRD